MKKTLAVAFSLVLLVLLAVGVGAEAYKTIEPNSDGLYKTEITLMPNNEYVFFAIKGTFDQTNHIEAFERASDEDIIYFEQRRSDENGKIVLGPFAPMGYFDATLLVSGAGLDEMQIVGHLSAKGVSNNAKVTVSGFQSEYTVEGVGYADIKIPLEFSVLDSFGYQSMTHDVTSVTVDAMDDVSFDQKTGILTVLSTAKEQIVSITASSDGAQSTSYISIKRNASKATSIKIFADAAKNEPITSYIIEGTGGVYPQTTFYVSTLDQYGDPMEDNYTFTFDSMPSGSTVTPVETGESSFAIYSAKGISSSLDVTVRERPDYKLSALELYNLIKDAQKMSAKAGSEIVFSTDGTELFPDTKWVSFEKYVNLTSAITAANNALAKYGTVGNGDGDYSSTVSTLRKAMEAFENAVSNGLRVDVTSIAFAQDAIRLPISLTAASSSVVTTPALSSTTDFITYTSSDTSVLTVDTAGNMTAKADGTVTVTAKTRAGLTAKMQVTVYTKVTRIEFVTKIDASYGTDKVIEAKIYPANHSDELIFTVSDPAIADIKSVRSGGTETVTITPKAKGTATVKIEAVGGQKSASATLNVTLPDWQKAPSPVSSTPSGQLSAGQKVSLSSTVEGAVIYYTLDGTTPSRTNGRVYKGPIAIHQNLTLRAIVTANGMFDSDVASYTYTVLDSTVSVTDGIINPGSVGDVVLKISNHSGMKSARIEISFSGDKMSVSDVILSEHLSIIEKNTANAGKLVLEFSVKNASSFDGSIARLRFNVPAGTLLGRYAVTVDKAALTMNDLSVMDAKVSGGSVTVRNFLKGDADDDGKIGLSDVLIIKQYLAGNPNAENDILLVAADANGDGKVDETDATLITRYCLGLISALA